ncbi:hypothetical protein LTT66_14595 [Nocardia gipuzkoensis]|uniref:molybdopterin dinucleotide binding domain-containing protein n=1 Tax=Nocardia gipuzkoensis TaxID=2749991 RepID=UPI001E4699F4|nr:molybdopterin dinucleotide binding domain-containing protein [Nocardia gipuzkoensis]UGT71261.1 hypothetical protein LTT66_14595 [Nocardia gipuzkoensis]
MHPDDAAARELREGEPVTVRSRTGSIVAPLEVRQAGWCAAELGGVRLSPGNARLSRNAQLSRICAVEPGGVWLSLGGARPSRTCGAAWTIGSTRDAFGLVDSVMTRPRGRGLRRRRG